MKDRTAGDGIACGLDNTLVGSRVKLSINAQSFWACYLSLIGIEDLIGGRPKRMSGQENVLGHRQNFLNGRADFVSVQQSLFVRR